MKLCVIGPTYPYKGGISHFTTVLVEELRKKSDVQFISWKRQYPAFLYPVEQKDNTSKSAIQTQAKFILDFLNPFTWVKSFVEIKKYNPDKLIFTWVTPVQAPVYIVIGFFIKNFTKIKILYLCHNVLPHEKMIMGISLAKLSFRYGDEFIVHSREDQKVLESIIGAKKIQLGFHPIYSVFNKEDSIDKDLVKKELGLKKNVLLFFGFIRPYKGLDYLLKAMPAILKELPETSLLIVGEFWSNLKDEYLKLISELKIQGRVVMIDDYVPNESIPKYFEVADVVMVPYTSATQSGIIQLAYAFEKPVIATQIGGLKDSVEEGKTGLFVESQNPSDIVKKVRIFFESGTNWESNINSVVDQFSWKKYIQILLDTAKEK